MAFGVIMIMIFSIFPGSAVDFQSPFQSLIRPQGTFKRVHCFYFHLEDKASQRDGLTQGKSPEMLIPYIRSYPPMWSFSSKPRLFPLAQFFLVPSAFRIFTHSCLRFLCLVRIEKKITHENSMELFGYCKHQFSACSCQSYYHLRRPCTLCLFGEKVSL